MFPLIYLYIFNWSHSETVKASFSVSMLIDDGSFRMPPFYSPENQSGTAATPSSRQPSNMEWNFLTRVEFNLETCKGKAVHVSARTHTPTRASQTRRSDSCTIACHTHTHVVSLWSRDWDLAHANAQKSVTTIAIWRECQHGSPFEHSFFPSLLLCLTKTHTHNNTHIL